MLHYLLNRTYLPTNVGGGFQGIRPSDQVGGTSDFLWSDQSIQYLNTPIQNEAGMPFPLSTQISSHKARSLFADIIGNTVDPHSPEFLPKIVSQLDDVLIKREDGELAGNIKRRASFGWPGVAIPRIESSASQRINGTIFYVY